MAASKVGIRVLLILNTQICPEKQFTAKKKPPYCLRPKEKKPRSACAKKGLLKLVGKEFRQLLAFDIDPDPGPERTGWENSDYFWGKKFIPPPPELYSRETDP
jgi:hypothetical protein